MQKPLLPQQPASPMTDRVTLQEPMPFRNEFKEEEEKWEDRGTVWADVEELSGREFYQAQQVRPDITVRVRLRYSSLTAPMDTRWRLKVISAGGRILNIASIIRPGAQRVYLELQCQGPK
jgi:SPP1 family predicted phage head-tail adaptor